MNTIVKRLPFALLSLAASLVMAPAQTNVAPTVVIVHAGMRPGTTFMDITFRVDDPDDTTVKVRALAFKDGVRSFANVIRPVTFVEGTGDKIGDAIAANATHALVWDVAADWNIDLGYTKFEILAMDGRGLLSFDWITIPAAGGYPEVTISKSVPSDAQVLDALLWLYSSGDPDMQLAEGGTLRGTPASGRYENEHLVSGASLSTSTPPVLFIYRKMNVSRASGSDKQLAIRARIIQDPRQLHAVNNPWNEALIGVDPNAMTTEIISPRWVKNTYSDGSSTMNDRFTGLMWINNPSAIVKSNYQDAVSLCASLVYNGNIGWMLPSMSQLVLIYEQRAAFVGLPTGRCWSSDLSFHGHWSLNFGIYLAQDITDSSIENVWPVCAGY